MIIPKHRTHPLQQKIRFCAYPDCNKEFISSSMSRLYCDLHTNPANRYRDRKVDYKKKILENNIILDKKDCESEIVLPCSLPGCKNIFRIKRITRISIYPKYCEEHRNEFKRKLFLKKVKEAV